MGLVEGDAADIALGELLKQASVAMKLRRPQRLLNFLGEDDGSCALITDPRRLEKMRAVAQLAAAINDYKSKHADCSQGEEGSREAAEGRLQGRHAGSGGRDPQAARGRGGKVEFPPGTAE